MKAPNVFGTLLFLLAILTWSAMTASDAPGTDDVGFGDCGGGDALLTVRAKSAGATDPVRVRVATRRLSPKPGQEDWDTLIDETWGWGLSTDEKLTVFDTFWTTVDRSFACFQGLEVEWDELRTRYRPEIEEGVSRGRFAAIMSRLSMALMDANTNAADKLVLYQTPSEPGVPLLHVGGWGLDSHFGAALTPLPDKSLLVYKTVPAHPLGLEPGDIVLGYEGRPWSEQYPELLGLGLPVTGIWGSSPESYEYSWLMAAGLNWHLFDTIDVRKYESGEVVHLSTSPMVGFDEELWVSEQMAVDGVPLPDFDDGHLLSWGIIDGTEIGYIYGWGWYWDAEQEFYDAVRQLMYERDTEGLILDFRFNTGGDMFLAKRGLELLFDQTVKTIDFAVRCNDADHLGLCTVDDAEWYLIQGDPGSYYDKPVAVLTGPGTMGAGELVALWLGYHPNARFFGMSMNAAFDVPAQVELEEGWEASFAWAGAFLMSDSGEEPPFDYQHSIHNDWREGNVIPPQGHHREFLTHIPFPVDFSVWLNPDDAAAGRDSVVEAAVQWITESRK